MNPTDFPITLALVGINVVLSIMAFNNRDIYSKAVMWPYGVKRQGQYYRFISSGFIHADWMHLIFNIFTLYSFGCYAEIYFKMSGLGGGVSYLLLYFLGLIVSDIPTYVKYRDDAGYHSLGASGAVMAVVFATLVFNPWGRVSVFGVLPISFFLYAMLFLFYCIQMAKKSSDNINHDAHLYGAVFGLAFTLALIGGLRPDLFAAIWELFKHPSLFGR